MAPIGNAMIMYLLRGTQRRREESVTINVLIWRNREGDDSGFTTDENCFYIDCGFTSSSLVSDVNLLPPLLLASIRRWCSKKIVIVIAATWIERNEGEKNSRTKNICLRLVHRKWQKTWSSYRTAQDGNSPNV